MPRARAVGRVCAVLAVLAAGVIGQDTATRPADSNHLGSEKSAYLRQHAGNPVHWWAWGDAPFAEAARRNCPVFVSIGYASCHWCHVMERESFADQQMADLMNAGFVCIKVDREERPDVDRVYMAAALAVAGGGGWPLNVVLTPERTAFLAFTYLPPDDRGGRAGLKTALTTAARNWQSSRALTQLRATNLAEWLTLKSMPLKALDAHIVLLEAEVARLGAAVESAPAESRPQRQTALDAVATRLARAQAFRQGRTAGDPAADPVAAAAMQLGAIADAVNGGLGNAPKFPTPLDALLLIRFGARPGPPLDTRPAPPHDPDRPAPPRLIGPADARDLVRRWYDAMGAGAIHDSIGGGFHRYTTDAAWEHPHFEKMLYDQALIALVWLELFRAGGAPHDAAMAAETLDFCRREMKAADGGFVAALDADTGGVEGATYQWSRKQLTEALKDVDAGAREVFLAWCGADRSGNEDALFNLKERRTPAEMTAKFGTFAPLLAAARAKLATVRAARPQPGRTEHVITGWNALMASAFARAARPLNRPDFLVEARDLMTFIERDLRRPDGLYARRRIAGESRFDGELSDQAAVIDALIDLHAATAEPAWLVRAAVLATRVVAAYGEADGGFTDSVASDVPIRTRELADNAWPAGTSAMNMALTRLALATNSPDWRTRAEAAFGAIREDLLRAPADMAWNVMAWDMLFGAPTAATGSAPPTRKAGA